MYKKKEISFDEVPQISERDRSYQLKAPGLRPFFKHDVSLDSFSAVVQDRKNFKVDRARLVKALEKQYALIAKTEQTQSNISALSEEQTYTIVTAHQPSLLTGPLYFIYKICSIISLTQTINEKNDGFKVVPVFIIGGEDHDFEEIATANIYGQPFTWNSDQIGPTGRMSIVDLEPTLSAIREKLGTSPNAQELSKMIVQAQAFAGNYADFMFYLVNELFGQYGLVVLNMDCGPFKEVLLPYVLKDLDQRDSERCVQLDQEALHKAGFHGQAHARAVNIFWIDGDRHRVMDTYDGKYLVNDKTYTIEELKELLKSDPSSISPNVILRPIFQEIILPNLAYIGGGGELAYWLERQSLFEAWDIPFPMLIRRDSLMIIDQRTNKWLEKSGMTALQLFDREEQVIATFAHLQSEVKIDLGKEREQLTQLYNGVRDLASKIDPTLEKTAMSELSKSIKSLGYLESKMLKAEKQKNDIGINKLTRFKQKLFPGGNGLQERHDNFIPFYIKYGRSWVDEIIKHCDPLNPHFKILIEE